MEINDFGSRMKELRESKGLTQKEAAYLLGVSRTSVLGYELGWIF